MDNNTFITTIKQTYFIEDNVQQTLNAMLKYANKEQIDLSGIFTYAQCIQLARSGEDMQRIITEAAQAKKHRKKDVGLGWY